MVAFTEDDACVFRFGEDAGRAEQVEVSAYAAGEWPGSGKAVCGALKREWTGSSGPSGGTLRGCFLVQLPGSAIAAGKSPLAALLLPGRRAGKGTVEPPPDFPDQAAPPGSLVGVTEEGGARWQLFNRSR